MGQKCTVCAAPANVRAAVDARLKEKQPLRELSKQTGFSRSGLSRHSRVCVSRTTVEEYRGRSKTDLRNRRYVVAWPADPPALWRYTADGAETELRDSDVLLTVRYVRAAVRNPTALLRAAAEDLESTSRKGTI